MRSSDWSSDVCSSDLPAYDAIVRLTTRERVVKRALLDAARLGPAVRLLDVGCGTGTFAISAKRRHPHLEVVGIDPDPSVLTRARDKARREQVDVTFVAGSATRLPFPDSTFDRMTSSLVFPPDHYPEANRGRRGATGAGGRGRAPRGRLGPGGEPAHARAVLVGSAARWGGDHEGPRAGPPGRAPDLRRAHRSRDSPPLRHAGRTPGVAVGPPRAAARPRHERATVMRSEEHTSELQSLMRIS